MKEPFTKRDSYTSAAYLDRETFKYFISRLEQIGFNQVTITIPTAVISGEKLVQETNKEKSYPLEAFLSLDRDFEGIILRALNSENNEEIRVLFRNNGQKKINFNDDIFSYVDKNIRSNYYISTFDPVRTYGLSIFIKDFFKNQVRKPGLRKFLITLAVIFLSFTVYLLINYTKVDTKSFIFGLLVIFGIFLGIVVAMPQTGITTSISKRTYAYPIYIEKLKENWLGIVTAALLSFIFALFGQFIGKILNLN